MAKTVLLILDAGRADEGHDFTEFLLEDDDNTWEVEQHSYGQPDVFSFVMRSKELDLVTRVANKEVRLELRDPRGNYLEGGLPSDTVHSAPGFDSVITTRLFGGVITEISRKRHGFEMDYNCKALGWIHLLENVLVSASFLGGISDRQTLIGRPPPNELSGIFERLEEADNSLNVDHDLRADIRCLVEKEDGSRVHVLVRNYDAADRLISIGEYNQDVNLRLDLDSAKESLDKISSLSDAEWRVDPEKVLWFLSPDIDSLDSELFLGDGTERRLDSVTGKYENVGKEMPVETWDYRSRLSGIKEIFEGNLIVPRPIAHNDNAEVVRFSVEHNTEEDRYELILYCDSSMGSNRNDYQGYSIEIQAGTRIGLLEHLSSFEADEAFLKADVYFRQL